MTITFRRDQHAWLSDRGIARTVRQLVDEAAGIGEIGESGVAAGPDSG